MSISNKELAALRRALTEIGSIACAPVREDFLLFQCLSSDEGERRVAAAELGTWVAKKIGEGNYNAPARRLERLEAARRATLRSEAPEDFKDVWEVTGDKRQGSLKPKTQEKTLMVLHAIAQLVDAERRLPTQVRIRDFLDGAAGARTVGDVVEEIEEASGLRFPDGRVTGKW